MEPPCSEKVDITRCLSTNNRGKGLDGHAVGLLSSISATGCYFRAESETVP